MNTLNKIDFPHKQLGAATLMISLILLFSITLITIYAAKNSLQETKISANEYRVKQALEAAQAGLEIGIGTLRSSANQNLANNDGWLDKNDTVSYSGTLPNGTSYSVVVNNIVQGDFDLLQINATGSSDDGSSTRTVSQIVQIAAILLNTPNSGVLAGGTITLGGSSQIQNIDPAVLPSPQRTAISGGNANCTNCAGAGRRPPGQCTTAASVGFVNNDVLADPVAGDPRISERNNDLKTLSNDSDAFFEAVFGVSKETLKGLSTQVDCSSGCRAELDGVEGEIIWIKGDARITSNITIGSHDRPVILIVEGEVNFAGTVDFTGLVYATNARNTGTADVTGAVITQNNYDSMGNMCVSYDSGVLNNLRNATAPIAEVTGSWHD